MHPLARAGGRPRLGWGAGGRGAGDEKTGDTLTHRHLEDHLLGGLPGEHVELLNLWTRTREGRSLSESRSGRIRVRVYNDRATRNLRVGRRREARRSRRGRRRARTTPSGREGVVDARRPEVGGGSRAVGRVIRASAARGLMRMPAKRNFPEDGCASYLSLAEETAGGTAEDGGGRVGVELGGRPGLLLLLLLRRGGGVSRAHGQLGRAGSGQRHGASLDGLAGEGGLASARDGGGDARGALRRDDSGHYASTAFAVSSVLVGCGNSPRGNPNRCFSTGRRASTERGRWSRKIAPRLSHQSEARIHSSVS